MDENIYYVTFSFVYNGCKVVIGDYYAGGYFKVELILKL